MIEQKHIVDSWKDPDFRYRLPASQLATMPSNPAGLIELSDEELLGIDGGTGVLCSISVIVTIGSIIVSAYTGCISA